MAKMIDQFNLEVYLKFKLDDEFKFEGLIMLDALNL